MMWLRMIRGADEEAVFSQTAKLNGSGDKHGSDTVVPQAN